MDDIKLALKLVSRFTPHEQAELADELEKFGEKALKFMIKVCKDQKRISDEMKERVKKITSARGQ